MISRNIFSLRELYFFHTQWCDKMVEQNFSFINVHSRKKKISLIGLFLDKLYYSYSTWILNFQCLDFRKAFFRRNSVCSGTRAGSSSRVKQHTPITQPDHCSEIACACAPHDGLVFVYPLAQVHVVFCTNFQKTVNFQEG